MHDAYIHPLFICGQSMYNIKIIYNILPFIYTHDVIYIYGIKGTENTCLVAKIIFIHTHTHIYTYTIINSII